MGVQISWDPHSHSISVMLPFGEVLAQSPIPMWVWVWVWDAWGSELSLLSLMEKYFIHTTLEKPMNVLSFNFPGVNHRRRVLGVGKPQIQVMSAFLDFQHQNVFVRRLLHATSGPWIQITVAEMDQRRQMNVFSHTFQSKKNFFPHPAQELLS